MSETTQAETINSATVTDPPIHTIAPAGTISVQAILEPHGTVENHATIAPTSFVETTGTVQSPSTVTSPPFPMRPLFNQSAGVTISHPGTIASPGTVAPQMMTSHDGAVASPGTVASGSTIVNAGQVAYWAVTDPKTGAILTHGNMPRTKDTPNNLKLLGASEISAPQYLQIKQTSGQVALVGGQIQPVNVHVQTATAQASAIKQVNAAAIRAYGTFMNGGAAELWEFEQTVADAKAVSVAPDPLVATLYPWLQVDVTSANAAPATEIADAGTIAAAGTVAETGTLAPTATVAAPYTLRSAASTVLAKYVAWTTFGTQVKTVRLAAIAEIKASTTQTEMQMVVNGLKWPTAPGG